MASVSILEKNERAVGRLEKWLQEPKAELEFAALRQLCRFALEDSSGDLKLKQRLRAEIKDRFVKACVEGFSTAYPYYGNRFALAILGKLGVNMAPVFMHKLAFSPEPVARGIYNLILRYSARRVKVRQALGHAPFTVVLNPTNRCNRNCKECYMGSGLVGREASYPPREMTVDQMSLLIEQMKDFYGTNFITWTGGEPLLRWKEMVQVLERHPDIFGVVFTNNDMIGSERCENGRPLGETVLDEFARVGNVSIGNSFEGSPEYTDDIRGKGAFDNALRAMKWEKERQLFFGPSLTPTNDNVDYILSEDFIRLIKDELAACFVYYFACMPIGPDPASNMPYLLTPEKRLTLVWGKSKRILEGDPLLHMDFWNDGALVQGCIAAGQNYLNFSPPHLPREQIEAHVKRFGCREKDVVTAVLPCVFFQAVAGFVVDGGRVIGKEELYDSIPQFVENDPSMKGFREGFQREIRDRMAAGEHWLGSAPCLFYDHPDEGLMALKDSFIALQPTFRIHSSLHRHIKALSREWREYIQNHYLRMVTSLNAEYDLGLEEYIEEQKEVSACLKAFQERKKSSLASPAAPVGACAQSAHVE